MKLLSVILCFLLLLTSGCMPSSNTSNDTETSSQVSRVVSLTSIATDIIYRLDATKLVGISGSRLLDKNTAFQDLTRVSTGRTQPNLETIAALEPDLVIGATGFHDQILTRLQSLGIETITTELDSWQSLDKLTRTLATAIQADPEPLLQSYQQFLPSQSPNASTSTLVLVSRQPLLSPNQDSWAGDLLTKFGADNIVAQLQGKSPIQGYVTLSPEKVLQFNPQVLILVNVEEGDSSEFKSQPFWKELDAVKNDQVYEFDYYGFVNAGSLDAIAKACKQLREIYSQ